MLAALERLVKRHDGIPRTIAPRRLYWGIYNETFPDPTWLLQATDVTTGEIVYLAMDRVSNWHLAQ